MRAALPALRFCPPYGAWFHSARIGRNVASPQPSWRPPDGHARHPARPDQTLGQHGEGRGAQPGARPRVHGAAAGAFAARHGGRGRDRQRLHRADHENDGGSDGDGGRHRRHVGALCQPVAGGCRAGSACGARQTIQGPGLGGQCGVRVHQAELPDLGRLDPLHGARRQGSRRRHRPQGRLLYKAVRRRDRAVELHRHQSRGAARDASRPAEKICCAD